MTLAGSSQLTEDLKVYLQNKNGLSKLLVKNFKVKCKIETHSNEDDPLRQPIILKISKEALKQSRIKCIESSIRRVKHDIKKLRKAGTVEHHSDNLSHKKSKNVKKGLPKQALKQSGIKRRKAGTVEDFDYLSHKKYKNVKRRRSDPLVELGTVLGDIHSELLKMDEALEFLKPVNTKKVVDYLDLIETPMYLQTIKERILERCYNSREAFLTDVHQIKINSEIYNGPDDILTANAKKLLSVVMERFTEKEDHLINLEKQINPLLDDDNLKKLSYILKKIIEDDIKGPIINFIDARSRSRNKQSLFI